jgi:hypothetical protein
MVPRAGERSQRAPPSALPTSWTQSSLKCHLFKFSHTGISCIEQHHVTNMAQLQRVASCSKHITSCFSRPEVRFTWLKFLAPLFSCKFSVLYGAFLWHRHHRRSRSHRPADRKLPLPPVHCCDFIDILSTIN